VKQLDLGLLMYVDDADQHLPFARLWASDLHPYTKNDQLCICPELVVGEKTFGHGFYRPMGGKLFTKIESPASQVVLFDSTDTSWNANGILDLLPPAGRHKGGLNTIGFADGHATQKTRLNLFRNIGARVP